MIFHNLKDIVDIYSYTPDGNVDVKLMSDYASPFIEITSYDKKF